MKRKKGYDKSVFQALVQVTQFGLAMLVPIAMMTAAGIWLDRKLGTSFFVVIFFFLGALGGGRNIYRTAMGIGGRPGAGRRAEKPASGNSDTGWAADEEMGHNG